MNDTMATNPAHLGLSIPSHPKYLQLVRGMVKKISAATGMDDAQAANIMLAVVEACSNSIKHSYKGQPHGQINIFWEITHTELIIIIEDFGCQWEPDNLAPRDLDEIRPGGLGLHIMQCVMDCVDFDCSSTFRNQVKMIKQLGEKP
jgi:anti-sigma regulatory factor (Ser/Thr protein kinase)